MFDNSLSQFSIDPFSEKAGHKFYSTPELMQRLNLIRHLMQQSEQLVLVLAEEGYGKTTLISELRNTADEHWEVVEPNSSPALSPEVLLSFLSESFKIRLEGKQVSEEIIRNHIATVRYNGQLPVMIVDDAHRLPLATLKLIVELNITGEKQNRMRVLLFCEPQITSILATPELQAVHNTLVHTLDIPPLSQQQTFDYIKFYLKNTQYEEQNPFYSDMLKDIYVQSEGIPERINAQAQQVLNKSATQQTQRHFLDILPYKKWLSIFSLIALFIGAAVFAYGYYFNSKKSANTDTNQQDSIDVEEVDISLPSAEESLVEPVVESSEISEEKLSQEELIGEPEKSSDSLAEQSGASANTFEAPLNNTEFPAVGESKESVNISTEQATNLANVQPPVPSEQSDNSQHEQPSIVPTESTGSSLPSPTAIKTEAWLRSQNPKSFTVQIVGTYTRLTVDGFITKYALTDVAVFKTKLHSRDWYVLVCGVYETRDQANAALEKLPSALTQNTRPWVRSLSSIQNLIKE